MDFLPENFNGTIKLSIGKRLMLIFWMSGTLRYFAWNIIEMIKFSVLFAEGLAKGAYFKIEPWFGRLYARCGIFASLRTAPAREKT